MYIEIEKRVKDEFIDKLVDQEMLKDDISKLQTKLNHESNKRSEAELKIEELEINIRNLNKEKETIIGETNIKIKKNNDLKIKQLEENQDTIEKLRDEHKDQTDKLKTLITVAKTDIDDLKKKYTP